MDQAPLSSSRAWSWIPSLYFTQGLPNVAVAALSVALYKSLGVSNPQIAFYTSWLYLPWVVKPLWSPVVELLGRKRHWIVATQFLMGAVFAAVALTIPGPAFFQATLALFWLLAFSSATHDIAADGFYLLALPEHQRAAFVGVRSTFFRFAMIAGQGGLVFGVGRLIKEGWAATQAWSWAFAGLAVFFVLVAVLHQFVLPRPSGDAPAKRGGALVADGLAVFGAFFRKPGIGTALAFMLLYRLGEAQLVKLIQPFLLDSREKGGLGLSLDQVGWYYGTIGTGALLAGGLLGGWVVSRWGLKRLLWPMVCAIHVPNLAYVYLAVVRPDSFAAVGGAIAIEQFGYGFGFTAYMLYLMLFAEGENKTAHYAICTGFMALGMMLPGMASGWLQEQLGYVWFFGWVCLATIPSFAVTALIKVDDHFGRRRAG
ncbi:MAG: MFS transporter [Opitutaceae bacterium]|nr:MFS transporter [Opitutaceae bacterium]